MQSREAKKLEMKSFRSIKPRPVSLTRDSLIRSEFLSPQETLPLILQPQVSDMDLLNWVKDNREFLASNLLRYGGILFRGFDIDDAPTFEQLARAFSPTLMDYLDQHTPRTKVTDSIYTSTEYPSDHYIPFHSENSKNNIWPMKIWFFCLQPASAGGETPIADNRKVFNLLDPQLKERFIKKQVMYVRNFGEGVGLSWQTAFQTTDRTVVENYCRQAGMEFVWKEGNRLRLRHVCQAISRHPITHDTVWFNQAHLFHVAGLRPAVRQSLLELFSEEDLPSNAYYGDGTRIEDSVIEDIREIYDQVAVVFPWQSKDLLMLDNMLIAHGRTPFVGARKVLVAMADSFGSGEIPHVPGDFN
jgi:alpha-ketoglutarate-dependent taurine dioxygenase